MYKLLFKPVFDIIISILLIIAFSPIFVVVFIILTITNNGSPFFTQVRPGKNEKLFKIIKFKTMNDKLDSFGKPLPDEVRITFVGNIVRKLSLDEIPQLINVIKGDMSIIGPRPLLPEYLSLYNSHQKKRHKVKPGITGWAQVNGRNAISWKEKFEYDVWYVSNISLLLDLKIIFRTIKKVIIKEGISSVTSVTVEKYNGSN